MLSLISVAVNCGIMFWTSNALDSIFPLNQFQQFMALILIEHVIIGIKMSMSIVISDKPGWVTEAEQSRELYADKI